MEPLVIVERSESVVSLTLNAPAKRNALGTAMFDALEQALAEAAQSVNEDRGASLLRLRGRGNTFCAGFDLTEAAAGDGGEVLAHFLMRLSGVLRALRRGPWIAVAEVRGAALAGGCALLSACDFVVAADDALFGYPVHRLGLSPAVTAPFLSATVGSGAARSLLLSGERIDGAEALRRGLVTHAVAPGEVGAASEHLLAQLGAKGPVALLETKRWLNRLEGSDDDDRCDDAMHASVRCCNHDECTTMLRAAWSARRS
ncbi:MAG: enoyl-CoA hydratase/isomerase family protein [Phycisphaeraceae bacterium]|nr:enoyl-CoA hydratase/isomerase family protein [Phycisphaeraceae bacterium]